MTNHIVQGVATLHEKAGFYIARQYGLLFVTGKDATSFLHSQLTNDINELKAGDGQFSCLLDRKAHVQAYFHIYRDSKPLGQSFYIIVEKDQINRLVQSLEQYRFAAEVEFIDKSDLGYFVALEGRRASKIFSLLNPELYLHPISKIDTYDTEYGDKRIKTFKHSLSGENGYLFWLDSDSKDFEKNFKELCKKLDFIELSDEVINTARIEAGLAKFHIDFDKDNLLPETGLIDKTVNYNKGCFVGQEILARVRSHGTPAQALIGIAIEDEKNISYPINSPIVANGQEIGKIKSNTYSPTINKLVALVILKRDYRIPDKILIAQIDNTEVQIKVTLTPFVQIPTNAVLAHKLYEKAVEQFVQTAEGVKPNESIEILKEALLLDAQNENAYEALAVILSKYNELDAAIYIMKALADLNTDSVMAHSNLSQFYMLQGLKELAEEEKANALNIRMRLAAAQFKDQKREEAEREEQQKRKEMFEQVLAIDKEDFFANAGLGECLVTEKNFAQAIPYLKKAIELKSIHLTSYLDLAKALKETGFSDEAKNITSTGISIATKRGDTAMLLKLQDEAASSVDDNNYKISK